MATKQGYLPAILDEIVKQSKVEFNYSEETGDVEVDIVGKEEDERAVSD